MAQDRSNTNAAVGDRAPSLRLRRAVPAVEGGPATVRPAVWVHVKTAARSCRTALIARIGRIQGPLHETLVFVPFPSRACAHRAIGEHTQTRTYEFSAPYVSNREPIIPPIIALPSR